MYDALGTIQTVYLQEYYTTSLLNRFNEHMKKKQLHLAKKDVFFYQDFAELHQSVIALAKLN